MSVETGDDRLKQIEARWAESSDQLAASRQAVLQRDLRLANDDRDLSELEPIYGDPFSDVIVENGNEPHSISKYLAHPSVAKSIGQALAK